MSLRFRIPTLVLCLVLLVTQFAAQLGAPGEKKGKGRVVFRAAQIIDGTGACSDQGWRDRDRGRQDLDDRSTGVDSRFRPERRSSTSATRR